MKKLIYFFIFLYILSLFFFTYRPEYSHLTIYISGILVSLSIVDILIFNTKIFKGKIYQYLLMFLIVVLISSLISESPSLSFVYFKTIILNVSLTFIIYNLIEDSSDLYKIVKYYVFSGFLASLYLVYSNLGNILSIRIGGTLGNENEIGMIIGVACILSLALYEVHSKLIYLPMIIITFITTILTGSRSAILFLIVAAMIFHILKKERFIFKVSKIVIMVILIIVTYYLFIFDTDLNIILKDRFLSILYLFTDIDRIDFSTLTRFRMITYGLELFSNKPLFGFGVGNYRYMYNTNFGLFSYSHSNFIELLVGVGLVGTIVFYFMFIRNLSILYRIGSKDRFVNAIFSINFALLLISISVVFYYSKWFYILLVLTFSIIRVSKISKKEIR